MKSKPLTQLEKPSLNLPALLHLLPTGYVPLLQTACSHFQAGLLAVSRWPWAIFSPVFLLFLPLWTLFSPPEPAQVPTFPKPPLVPCEWRPLPPVHLGGPSAHCSHVLHSFSSTLNSFWFLLISHPCSEVEATQHKDCILGGAVGSTTPSVGFYT